MKLLPGLGLLLTPWRKRLAQPLWVGTIGPKSCGKSIKTADRGNLSRFKSADEGQNLVGWKSIDESGDAGHLEQEGRPAGGGIEFGHDRLGVV